MNVLLRNRILLVRSVGAIKQTNNIAYFSSSSNNDQDKQTILDEARSKLLSELQTDDMKENITDPQGYDDVLYFDEESPEVPQMTPEEIAEEKRIFEEAEAKTKRHVMNIVDYVFNEKNFLPQGKANQLKRIEKLKLVQNHEVDTGSSEAQIAQFTMRIEQIRQHMRVHKKDVHSRKGLDQLWEKRRKMLRYLRKRDKDRYLKILKTLELKPIRREPRFKGERVADNDVE